MNWEKLGIRIVAAAASGAIGYMSDIMPNEFVTTALLWYISLSVLSVLADLDNTVERVHAMNRNFLRRILSQL